MRSHRIRISRGAAGALAAGVLFGASTPLAKQLGQGMGPWMLAGLLYLSSGLGLWLWRRLRDHRRGRQAQSVLLGTDRWCLAAAILTGGMLAPVLMMYGLRSTAGSSASLLLNLEAVFSILLAWFLFHENFDRKIALGVALITAGALFLSSTGNLAWGDAVGPIAIAAACFAWALDNNLTRKVALNDVTQIAMLKGLVAGSVNIAIAVALGGTLPGAGAILSAGVVGVLGYGVSLVLFVLALRHLGTARTAAYFSIAPFAGAIVAVAFFGEPVTIQLLGAAALMITGLWLHLAEFHDHEHTHESKTHYHEHVHDEHHRHRHDADEQLGMPHAHAHTHEKLRHRHAHLPDEHHRHAH